MLPRLLALADAVPYTLRHATDPVEAWFVGWQLKSDYRRRAEAFNDDSCLAQGQEFVLLKELLHEKNRTQAGRSKGRVSAKTVTDEFERRLKSNAIKAEPDDADELDDSGDDGGESPRKPMPLAAASPMTAASPHATKAQDAATKAQVAKVGRVILVLERVLECGGRNLVTLLRSKELTANGRQTWASKKKHLLHVLNFRRNAKELCDRVITNLIEDFDNTAMLGLKQFCARVDLEYFRFGLMDRMQTDFAVPPNAPCAEESVALLTGAHFKSKNKCIEFCGPCKDAVTFR